MSRRNEKGRGSVFQMADGTWVAKISVRGPDGKRKRIQRKARSEAHAKILRDELLAEYPERKVSSSATLTVAAFLSRYLETAVLPELATGTYQSYETAIRNHIVPWIGNQWLRSLKPLEINEWLATLLRNGTGARTRQNAYAVLRAALEEAVRLQVIPANPCGAVRRPTVKRGKIRVFELSERMAILDAVVSHRLFGAYLLALTLGMRQGELFGLQWKDIDFAAGALTVERQAVENKGRVEIGPPKTEAGFRTIPLDDDCLESLRERQRVAMTEGLAACEWVFPSRRGTVMHRSNFGNRHWRPLLKRLGIANRGMHHCRHTAAVLMLGAGIPAQTVCGLLGHADPSVTLRIYSHFVPSDGRAAVQQMAPLLRRVASE
jgi:integrase